MIKWPRLLSAGDDISSRRAKHESASARESERDGEGEQRAGSVAIERRREGKKKGKLTRSILSRSRANVGRSTRRSPRSIARERTSEREESGDQRRGGRDSAVGSAARPVQLTIRESPRTLIHGFAGIPCTRETAGGGRQRPAGSQREAHGLTNRPISRDDEVLRLIPPHPPSIPEATEFQWGSPLAEPRTPSRVPPENRAGSFQDNRP